MPKAFVWFHHNSDSPTSNKLFEELLGWKVGQGPGKLTMLAGDNGPLAATGEKYGDAPGWIPFVEVDDVDAATKKAVRLGAAVVREKSPGPAGEFSIVRDPSGAAMGLWKKA